ncbi:MAG: hypothetical protein FJ083_01340 [Cyanobacteria bacterium K_Offshore_surface_m2_239]|nr:hypothetical protein [Cyanobacteria bacterium K_Offshore_surface_m2_239]
MQYPEGKIVEKKSQSVLEVHQQAMSTTWQLIHELNKTYSPSLSQKNHAECRWTLRVAHVEHRCFWYGALAAHASLVEIHM